MLINARVLDLGFSVGMGVIRKADEVEAKIHAIEADEVHLMLSDGQVVRVSSDSFVSGKWKVHKPKQEPVPLADWSKHAPSHSVDLLLAGMKGVVISALRLQYQDFKAEKFLEVYIKPSKNVCVTKAFSAASLKIPVTTTRVEIRRADQDAPHAGILAGKVALPDHSEAFVYLLPSFVAPKDDGSIGFLSPAWAMRVSSERSECNMEIRGPSKAWHKQKLSTDVSAVSLPVVTNFQQLSAGESLVLFRPELAKAEPVEALQPVAKKPRCN